MAAMCIHDIILPEETHDAAEARSALFDGLTSDASEDEMSPATTRIVILKKGLLEVCWQLPLDKKLLSSSLADCVFHQEYLFRENFGMMEPNY